MSAVDFHKCTAGVHSPFFVTFPHDWIGNGRPFKNGATSTTQRINPRDIRSRELVKKSSIILLPSIIYARPILLICCNSAFLTATEAAYLRCMPIMEGRKPDQITRQQYPTKTRTNNINSKRGRSIHH